MREILDKNPRKFSKQYTKWRTVCIKHVQFVSHNMVKSRLKFKRLLLLLKPRSNALSGTSLVYKWPTIHRLFATTVTETSMILTRTRWIPGKLDRENIKGKYKLFFSSISTIRCFTSWGKIWNSSNNQHLYLIYDEMK